MVPHHWRLLRQVLAASGYAVVLVPPALLMAGAWLHLPWLTFGSVMLAFPLMRPVFGAVAPGEPPHWDERVSWALDRLGWLYGAALGLSVLMVLACLHAHPPGVVAAIGWALSLWATLVFATCVAHDLLHRQGQRDRLLGHLIAGASGYPLLGYEHSRHHRLPGNTAAAEWPRVDETVWHFAWRRTQALFPETLGRQGLLIAGNPRSPVVRGLRTASAATLATLALFGLAAGAEGMLIYAAAMVLVGFAIQLVTYLQHWGLGDDNCPDSRRHGYSWESDCRFQAWITLNLSLHQTHHDQGTLPYYRAALAPTSPRLPMGYVLLMFVAFVPPLWRRVMDPALAYWKAQPTAPLSSGRALTCVAIYR